MNIYTIINPVSGGGAGKAGLQRLLTDPFYSKAARETVFFSENAGHIKNLAKRAINERASHLVVIGGDGTLHEAMNGLLGSENPDLKRPILVPFAAGSGNDFIKTMNLCAPKIPLNLEEFFNGIPQTIDVGSIFYSDKEARTQSRYFLNMVNIGFGGQVMQRQQSVAGKQKTPYTLLVMKNLFRYGGFNLTGNADGVPLSFNDTFNVSLGNGKYCGRGMRTCPEALPADGKLDFVRMARVSKPGLMFHFGKILLGLKPSETVRQHIAFRKLSLHSEQEVFLEADGEWLGCLPVTVEVGAVKIACLPGLVAAVTGKTARKGKKLAVSR